MINLHLNQIESNHDCQKLLDVSRRECGGGGKSENGKIAREIMAERAIVVWHEENKMHDKSRGLKRAGKPWARAWWGGVFWGARKKRRSMWQVNYIYIIQSALMAGREDGNAEVIFYSWVFFIQNL